MRFRSRIVCLVSSLSTAAIVAGLAVGLAGASEPAAPRRFHLSMAGSGDPWAYWTSTRQRIVAALHEGRPLAGIAEDLAIPADSVRAELQPLIDIGLVEHAAGRYRPRFFIADRRETERTYAHAWEAGRFLARELRCDWGELEREFAALDASRSWSLDELAFVLVGGRILDIGVLGALVRDGRLLTPPPRRPSPERPDGRYYLWMVEGEPDHLGRYGQDDTDLARAGWHFVTFAQNLVDGAPNPARQALDAKCQDALRAQPDAAPEQVARALGVPFLSRRDSEAWAAVCERVSARLLAAWMGSGPDVRGFFRTLRTGRQGTESLGEFCIWYYHLAFAWAIDILRQEGVLAIPASRLDAVVLYREGPEGLLLGRE